MDLQKLKENLREALEQYGTSEVLQIVADIKNEQSVARKAENKPIEAQITRVIANVVTHSVHKLQDIIETGVIPPEYIN